MSTLQSKVLVLLPAWREKNADEEAWISALLRRLGETLGVVVAYDPGFPGDYRDGQCFTRRSWRDFREQCKEAIFENPVELVIAVGEAARIDNLDDVSGWAPNIPRVALFLESDVLRLRALRLKAVSDCSDLVLHRGDWKSSAGKDSCVEFIREPQDVLRAICGRFSLKWLPILKSIPKKRPSVDVFTRKRSQDAGRLAASLIRGLGAVAHGRHIEIDGTVGNEAKFWNQALRTSRADYLVFLDASLCRPDKALARMLEYFKISPTLAAVGAGDLRTTNPRHAVRLIRANSVSGGHREFGSFLSSACWMLSRVSFRQVGFFDENFHNYRIALCDYGFRLRQAGFRLLTATDITAWRQETEKAASSRYGRDFEFLKTKWCCGGIGAILKLCEDPKDARAQSARKMQGDGSMNHAPVLPKAIAAAEPTWADHFYGEMGPGLRGLMQASQNGIDRRIERLRRDMDSRFDGMSTTAHAQVLALRHELRQISWQQKILLAFQSGAKSAGNGTQKTFKAVAASSIKAN